MATSVLSLVVVPFTSLGFAITTQAARDAARSDNTSPTTLGRVVVVAFAVLGIGIGALIVLLAGPVARFGTQDPRVGHFALDYLLISAAGMPALCVVEAGCAYLTGVSKANRVLAITATITVTNIGVELVLVYGLGLSLIGSALGTDLAQLLGAVLVGRSVGLRLFVRRPQLGESLQYLVRSASTGGALIVRTLSLVGAISGAVIFASLISTPTLDAFQISQQVWLLFGLAFDAIAVPAQVLTSEWIGTTSYREIKLWGSRFLWVGLLLAGAIGVLLALLARDLTHLYTSSSSLWDPSQRAIDAAALVMPCTSVSFVIDGLLAGMDRFDRLRNAMVWSLVWLIGVCGVGLNLPRLIGGVDVVWVGFGSWLVVRSLLSYRYWRECRRQLDGGPNGESKEQAR